MAGMTWIKLSSTMFDDEKIQLIEAMPNADVILLIWVKLLCFAGKINNTGVLMFQENTPYTVEMLSIFFRRDIDTVRRAFDVFMTLGMIETSNGAIIISNWPKHQAVDAYEKQKAKDRERKKKQREKQRLLASASAGTSTDMSADVPPLEEDREGEGEGKREGEGESVPSDAEQASDMPPHSPIVATLLLKNGGEYIINQDKVDEWRAVYPAVDIAAELIKMQTWLLANPSRRKTDRNILRFIHNWLCDEQRTNASQGGGMNDSPEGSVTTTAHLVV